MRFFWMKEPEQGSDYTHTWVNGSASPKFGFPGVECSVCKRTGGLPGGILPYQLPDKITTDERLLDGWPVSEAEHRALQSKVEKALQENYSGIGSLPAGAEFPPITWELPSRPEGDVFWASLEGPIVSARVAAALRSQGATGFALIPVDHVRCGTGSPSEEAPIPDSGEPEDLSEWATETLAEGQEFFLLSVISEGRLKSNMHAQPACPGCSFIEIDRLDGWDAWDETVWAGDDIFHFPTTLWIVVTERIVDLFAELNAGNVEFTPLAPGDLVAEPLFSNLEWDDDEPTAAENAPGERRLEPETFTGAGDLERTARLIAAKGLTVARCREGLPEGAPAAPELEVGQGGKLMAYAVVQSLTPQDAKSLDRISSGVIRWLLARLWAKSSTPGHFDRVNSCVHEAIRRFDTVNLDRRFANILILVDHGSECSSNDLYDVLVADDESEHKAARGTSDGRIKGKKQRLDLCLWLDALKNQTEHFHLPVLSDTRRSLFLHELYSLGED